MEFQLPLAYGLSAGIGALMCGFAAWNRHTGWKRKRSDDFLEIMTLWAAAETEDRRSSSRQPAAQPAPLKPVSVNPATVTSDLRSLQTALGVAPARVTVQQPEEQRVETPQEAR